jgi:hypothetical protein
MKMQKAELMRMLAQEMRAGSASSPVVLRLLASGMDTSVLRTNDTLRKDEWIAVDGVVVKAAQERLVGVADLIRMDLVYRTGGGMGRTVLEYEDMSDVSGADLSMDGITRGRNDVPLFELKGLPLPIIHKDWQMSARKLAASRKGDEPLDTSTAALAARQVAEKAEQLLFRGGASFKFGGYTLYGLCDHPNRITGSLNAHWNDSAATGDTILDDVLRMKQASINQKHYGPWMVYVPTNFEVALDGDFKANSDKTVRQRLKEVAGILDVKVADMLTTDNVVMVQMTTDVVRWVEALPLQNLEWNEHGGMQLNFKVMTIAVPQIRADQEGNSGVVHYT